MAKINLKTLPVDLSQFAILNIESEKKEISPREARLISAPFVFLAPFLCRENQRLYHRGHRGAQVGVMIKKKGKGKATGRRSTKAKDTGKAKSERQPEEVRKEIEQLVQDD